jgi:RimJ/RimL family protein N-acetyltransferase
MTKEILFCTRQNVQDVKISLRPVKQSDWRFILSVRNEDEVRMACHDTSVIDFETHKKYMQRISNDQDVVQWIVVCDGEDIGHTKIIGSEFGYMIKSGFRGKGLGAKIHRLVFEEAKKQGLRKLNVTIKVGNEPSLNLCRRTGFVDSGQVLNDGRVVAYTLVKTL